MKFGMMKSLGTKMGGRPEVVKEGKPPKQTIDYPTITVDAKDFPYLAGEENGATCMVCVKVQKEGQRLPSTWDKSKDELITLRLMEMGEEKHSEAGEGTKNFLRKEHY